MPDRASTHAYRTDGCSVAQCISTLREKSKIIKLKRLEFNQGTYRIKAVSNLSLIHSCDAGVVRAIKLKICSSSEYSTIRTLGQLTFVNDKSCVAIRLDMGVTTGKSILQAYSWNRLHSRAGSKVRIFCS
jgi:hypothetical protein